MKRYINILVLVLAAFPLFASAAQAIEQALGTAFSPRWSAHS